MRAACARQYGVFIGFGLIFALAGCGALPQPPQPAARYDFGLPAADARPADAARAPLVLAEVADAHADAGSALRYRLAYANAQLQRAYTQARWSQPPAQLLTQALVQRLGADQALLLAPEGLAQLGADGRWPRVLRVQLEEFSQVFDAPEASAGVLRLRATLTQGSASGEWLLAQRVFSVRVPAPTADAAGGARALADAAAQAGDALAVWVK